MWRVFWVPQDVVRTGVRRRVLAGWEDLPAREDQAGIKAGDPVFLSTTFSGDILAAWAERRRLAEAALANTATPAGAAALEAYLRPLITSGAPLPASVNQGEAVLAGYPLKLPAGQPNHRRLTQQAHPSRRPPMGTFPGPGQAVVTPFGKPCSPRS